jgi:hypothetical protein
MESSLAAALLTDGGMTTIIPLGKNKRTLTVPGYGCVQDDSEDRVAESPRFPMWR